MLLHLSLNEKYFQHHLCLSLLTTLVVTDAKSLKIYPLLTLSVIQVIQVYNSFLYYYVGCIMIFLNLFLYDLSYFPMFNRYPGLIMNYIDHSFLNLFYQ